MNIGERERATTLGGLLYLRNGGRGDAGYELRATVAAILGYMLDGMDTMVLSLTLTALGAAFALSSAEQGLLGFVLTGGMVVGGYTFGILADRFGRVRTFTYSILIYSVFTALTAAATGYPWLLVTRFLSGVGTGAEYGIGMTLMSEAFRAKWRGMGSTFVSMGWTVGVVIATVLALLLMPLYGWRAMYLIGVLPALLAAYVRWRIPESPMWVERVRMEGGSGGGKDDGKGRGKGAGIPLRDLFSRGYLRFTAVFLVIAIVAEMGYWGIMIWLPSALLTEYHVAFTRTIYILLATDGMVLLGMLVFGLISDIVGRRVAISAGFIGMTLSVAYFAMSRTASQVLVASLLTGFFVNSYFTIFGALFSEPYPTHARSTAVNFIFNTGRGFGGIAPLLVGILAPAFRISGVIGMFSLLFVVAAIAIWAVPETRGIQLR
ncbi:MFS transporter [Conexivisphaera calida]|nr:MFS transporter [Conexivisphaera calida]